MKRYEIFAWDNDNVLQDVITFDKCSDAVECYMHYVRCVECHAMYQVSLYDNTRSQSNTLIMNFSQFDVMSSDLAEFYMTI